VPRPVTSLLAILIVLLALAGCGSKSKTIAASHLSKLVLQQKDLPRAFSPFYLGKELGSDAGPYRSDRTRFGRRGGWTARFRRAGSIKAKGPLVVASRVDLFPDTDGATKDFDLLTRALRSFPHTKTFLPRLGSDAFGIVQRQGVGKLALVTYSFAWRRANSTAAIDVNGFAGKFSLREALALAHKQDSRMRAFVR
jgi:hypothetical protein